MSDRKHAQVKWGVGGSLAEVPYSSPMETPSFASNARFSAELMEVHVHGRGRHGRSGGDQGRGRRLVVRHGSSGRGVGGLPQRTGSHDRGLARGARGDQEGGPRVLNQMRRHHQHVEQHRPPGSAIIHHTAASPPARK